LTCPASKTVRGTGTCTLTVANAGPATAGKLVADVALPSALSEVSCTSGCARHANVFSWTMATLASGAQVKVAITVRANVPGRVLLLAAAAGAEPRPPPAEQHLHPAGHHQSLVSRVGLPRGPEG
jgi:hypothetical protein